VILNNVRAGINVYVRLTTYHYLWHA